MTVLFPEATPVHLNTKVLVADTIASAVAPGLTSEIQALTSLEISCFIRTWNPEIANSSGQAPDRLCSSLSLPIEGRAQLSPISISYVYDPQAATSTDDNKARLKLAQGTEFFIVVRKGKLYTTAFAVGDYTEVWKVRCGRQNYVRSGDDEFAEFEIQQNLYPILEPVHGQIAA